MERETSTKTETATDANTVLAARYIVAKIEKGTERIVGFLSKGKRRWLPPLSTKQRFEADKEFAERELNLLKSKYDWQTTTHNYYYKLFVCGA